MLAQNFVTHDTLGITQDEWAALIRVLGMLERGELVFVEPHDYTNPNGFNMTRVGWQSRCGSAGCILGWCRFITGQPLFSVSSEFPREVTKLFMYGDDRRFNVTVPQAAIALRNFLTTGDARWDEAIAA